MRKHLIRLAVLTSFIGMVVTGIQIISHRELLFLILSAIFLFFASYHLPQSWSLLKKIGNFFGIILLLCGAFSTIAFFLTLLISFFFILMLVLFFLPLWNKDRGRVKEWKKKNYVGVTIQDQISQPKSKLEPWIGTRKIGTQSYAWDDIHLSQFAGDTIVDLGNTILSDGQNVIMIQQVLGRVRIIVPKEVGIHLHTNAFVGAIAFENKDYELHNQTISLYSSNYQTSFKKAKVLVTVACGKVEVIRQ